MNSGLEAIIRLRLRGPSDQEREIDAIVDSGFTSSLTLPAETVAALGLVRQSGGSAMLADGSIRQFEIFAVEVFWDENWRPVLASVVGGEALLGMRLLARHHLGIEVMSGGTVQVVPLV